MELDVTLNTQQSLASEFRPIYYPLRLPYSLVEVVRSGPLCALPLGVGDGFHLSFIKK